ncbi:MAG TPA: hypothetical protein H9898_01020 [Candidatus Anaerobiospirillum stercoravium]|nr:hypothetical protein [Candidatus Anaerobiospirillum stercoravium]
MSYRYLLALALCGLSTVSAAVPSAPAGYALSDLLHAAGAPLVLEMEEEELASELASQHASEQAPVSLPELSATEHNALNPEDCLMCLGPCRHSKLIVVKHLKDLSPNNAEGNRAQALDAAYQRALQVKSALVDQPTSTADFLEQLDLSIDHQQDCSRCLKQVQAEAQTLECEQPNAPADLGPTALRHPMRTHTQHFELITTVEASEIDSLPPLSAPPKLVASAELDASTELGASTNLGVPTELDASTELGASTEIGVPTELGVSQRAQVGSGVTLSPQALKLAQQLLAAQPVQKLKLRLSFNENDPLFILSDDELQRTRVSCLQGNAMQCYLAGRHYDARVNAELQARLKAAEHDDDAAQERVRQASLRQAEKRQLTAIKERQEASLRDHTIPQVNSAVQNKQILVRSPGHDVGRDLPKIASNVMHMISFYRHGCTQGSQESCLMLANANGRIGVAITLGLIGLDQPQVALKYLQQGCDRRDPAACANLALVHFNGMLGTHKSVDQSVRELKQACALARSAQSALRAFDHNIALGCLSVGTIELYGAQTNSSLKSLAPDLVRAYQDLSIACNLNNLEGCALLQQLDATLERAALGAAH